MAKQRITITVDSDVAEAARAAVEAGDAGSVSAWVSEAIAERVARERRLQAAREAVAAYEAEFGVITEDEMSAARGDVRARAAVVGGRRTGGTA